MQETQVWSLGHKDPQQREWLPTPVFLPRVFYEQRGLAGYSPWGLIELDMTECLTQQQNSNWLSLHTLLKVMKLWLDKFQGIIRIERLSL